MFKKIVKPFFLLTLILLICAISKVDAQEGQTVSIPDTALADEIRAQLGLPADADITAAEMLNLTRLDAIKLKITNLTGLEHATNLSLLNLAFNSISDVSPLKGLTQLRQLDLLDNSISDISPLAGLTQLAALGLSENSISDVSPLKGLTQLRSLYLLGNSISDVSPLAGLTQLERLDLRQNPLSALAINTHIPAMQANGTEVLFDNRILTTPPAAQDEVQPLVEPEPTLAPDLVVSDIRVSKTSLAPGEQFTLFATVENQGGNRSNLTSIGFRYSPTKDVNPSDAGNVAGGRIEPLEANGRTEASASVFAPRQAGTYYYAACTGFILNEGDSNNNCSPWVSVTVVAPVTAPQPVTTPQPVTALKEVTPQPPDLVISDIRLSKATLAPGEQFTLFATVENRGTGQAPATTLQFQRATNDSYTQIGTRSVSALSANRSVEVSHAFTAPGQAGFYHYRAYIESVNKHSEWVSITVAAPVTTRDVVRTRRPPSIYWTDWTSDKIQYWDGSNVRDLVTGVSFPQDVALDVSGGKMYWASNTGTGSGKIQCANLDGSNVHTLVTGVGEISSLALDVSGGKIYWTHGVDKIQSANLNGSNVRDLVTGLNSNIHGIALDVPGGKMYWANYSINRIQCANLDGSNLRDLINTRFEVSSPAVNDIALDVSGGKIYWAATSFTATLTTGNIQCANLDGSNVKHLVTGTGAPTSLALDVSGGKIYWTLSTETFEGKIQCANLDGSNVKHLVTGTGDPDGIALGIPLQTVGGTLTTDTPRQPVAPTPTPTVSEPSRITISGPATHRGAIVNQKLDASLLVRVLDDNGNGVADAKVTFRVISGRGKVSERGNGQATGVRTDRSGYASADLTPLEEGTITVQASVTRVTQTVEFTITTGVAPTTIQMRIDAGDRPPMYWIDTAAGTLHRLVNAEVENLLPSVQNATSLTVDVANDTLYWAEKTSNRTGSIRSANLDGTNVQVLRDITSVPLNITLDATDGKLYWTNSRGKIQRLNLDGSGFQPNLITDLDTPTGIAVDVAGRKLYWIEKTGDRTGKIWRANLDGTNVALVRDLTSVPLDIALDTVDGKLYWTNSRGKVQRLNLDGSGFQPNFITDLDTPMDIAVDTAGQKLYLTSPNGKISRRDLNGGGSEEVVTGLRNPGALVLGGATTPPETTTGIVTTHSSVSMYWADSSTGKIQRANLDGSNVTDLVTDRHLLTNGWGNLHDIAVDVAGDKIYWTYSIQLDIESEEPSFMGKIQCSDLDGSNVTDLVTEESHVPEGIALDIAGGKMYWADTWNWKIRCSDLDGSNVTDLVTELAANARDIAVDVVGGKMYWTSVEWTDERSRTTAKIRCSDLDGSNVTDLVTKQGHINGIALDVADGKMYTSWGERDDTTETWNSKIQCSDLDGSNVTDLVTEAGYPPEGIALDVSSGKMYWTSWGEWGEATIRSANLDGSNVTDLVTIGFGTPGGIALGIPLENTGGDPRTKAAQVRVDRLEDVNQDGKVDNVDLGMVAAALFGGNPPATLGRLDVNGDGVLTIDDLTQVSNNLDEDDAAAAPTLGIQPNALDREKIQTAIDLLLATDDGSIGVQRTLAYLQILLAAARPDETRLLANYPNPFNPETWLPYALATDSNVALTIYNVSGKVVRQLVLGYQSAGYYTSQSRAAYWDGRNAQGERVASGVYFYNLTTGDFTATRRMLILK